MKSFISSSYLIAAVSAMVWWAFTDKYVVIAAVFSFCISMTMACLFTVRLSSIQKNVEIGLFSFSTDLIAIFVGIYYLAKYLGM